jgi:hypothetical protein
VIQGSKFRTFEKTIALALDYFRDSVSLDSRSNRSVEPEILQYLSRQSLADFPQHQLELRQAAGDGCGIAFARLAK